MLWRSIFSSWYADSPVFPIQERMEFDEPDFALIDTLFSLAEAHLFMQLIELQDNHPERLPAGKSCADIYRYGSYAACGCPCRPIMVTMLSRGLYT